MPISATRNRRSTRWLRLARFARRALPTLRRFLPPASRKQFAHVLRDGRDHPDQLAPGIERNHDFGGVEMQRWTAVARRTAVDRIADDRPAFGRAMHAQLMRAAGHRRAREPGDIVVVFL